MIQTYKAAADIDVLTSSMPIPGYGLVPINAFVIKGAEPVLVDTGAVVESDEFMSELQSVIDPNDLKWIWLTHPDFDHIGCLHRLMADNPGLRVITNFLSVGILSLSDPLPLDRVHLLNPGGKLPLRDRTLTAIKPPVFDNPSTTGFYDDKSGAFFSADCFGALLSSLPQSAADLSDKDLREGQCLWATVDAPWLHRIDRNMFLRDLENIRTMQPRMVLSSHLPAAPGHMTARLLESLAAAPESQPFVGPDQVALQEMLSQITGASQSAGTAV
jgi:flavorubredoxin